jgi:4-alpha-glucanotransferase
MRVLMFAFGEDNPKHPYLPKNFVNNCVVYTGTHDNNTARGWFEKETSVEDRKRLSKYVGREVNADDVSETLIGLAMDSVADTVLIPMQDLLGLGEEARMNMPARASGNWAWRVTDEQLSAKTASWLRSISEASTRLP